MLAGLADVVDHCALVLGVLLRLRSAFDSIAHAPKHNERKDAHSPPLLWLEGLVKRLPRVC